MSKLKEESENMGKILEQVKYRSEWIKYQEQQKQKEEEALERERSNNLEEIGILIKVY